jgi:periplasmic divalent cation tolerance protein
MSAVMVYITAGSLEEARKIGGSLVEARLAACANIFEGMRSVYRWEDEIREETEVVLFAKTRSELVDELVAWVKEIHSYDCPCVVALPIQAGNPAFLDWIAEETTEED